MELMELTAFGNTAWIRVKRNSAPSSWVPTRATQSLLVLTRHCKMILSGQNGCWGLGGIANKFV